MWLEKNASNNKNSTQTSETAALSGYLINQ